MKYIKAILVLSFVMMLSSCCGREPNDVAYAVALGFDKADNGNYMMTIQFAHPTNISGGSSEEGGKGTEIVENLAVEAPDIYSGIGIANHVISKHLTLAHAKLIVFSEEVAKDGIKDIMETVIRNEEIRPDIYMAVALDNARDYLYEVKPVIEINPARYYQLIYEQHCSAGLPTKNAIEFCFDLNTGMQDSALPLAGIIQSDENESGGSSQGQSGGESSSTEGESPEKTENKDQKKAAINDSGFDFKLRDYIAGEVAINQENKSEAMGMAIFKNGKEIKHAGSLETKLYKMLNGSFKESYMTLENSKGEPVTIRARQSKKPKYTIDKKKEKVGIELFFESDLYSLPADYNLESDIADFEELAKKEIKEASEKFTKDVMKANNVDLLGLRKKFRKCFLTNEEFEREKDNIINYDISVKVNLTIRRTGLTIKEAIE